MADVHKTRVRTTKILARQSGITDATGRHNYKEDALYKTRIIISFSFQSITQLKYKKVLLLSRIHYINMIDFQIKQIL